MLHIVAECCSLLQSGAEWCSVCKNGLCKIDVPLRVWKFAKADKK